VKSKVSYFSISTSLIKENMRRFWAIPVISFLVYFLSGVFPILMTYEKINSVASYIEMSLNNLQPFYMGAHLLVPVITAVILFRYLQSISSVAVMHSLPFTRPKLFNSSFISGVILIVSPILLNGIILLLLSKPAYRVWGYGVNMTIDSVNVFSRGAILNWMLTSVIIVLVLFSISVFSGIITGNNLVHLLASFFFIFLVSILYAVFNIYFQEFLYGFRLSGDWVNLGLMISPYTGILESGGHFSLPAILFYIATFIIMYIISAFLYNKRKLERATDSLTFEFLKPILCYIITFLGMTLLGFYFQVLGYEDSQLYMYAGFAAGTIIFFIIGQMIVTKTARIFNKKSLKSLLIYIIIAVLFLVGLISDVTGFETRVPDPQKVNSAILYDNFFELYYRHQFNENDFRFKDPDNLKTLTEFHKSILDNRNRFEEVNEYKLGHFSSIDIQYDTDGPFDPSRSYRIDYQFYANNEALSRIFESLEFKAIYSLYNLGVDSFDRIFLNSFYYSGKDGDMISDSDQVNDLIACMEKDFREMTFEEIISPRYKYAVAEIEYTYIDTNSGGQKKNRSISYNIPLTAKNTIKWLKEHGYDFDIDVDMIEYIEIFETQEINKTENKAIRRITDKELIQQIVDRFDTIPIRNDDAYSIQIRYRLENEEHGGFDIIYGYLNEGIDFLNN
jgi:ABC-2 type transport system permease protein